MDYIRRQPNIKEILGNHEFIFLKCYDGLMRPAKNEDDIAEVLHKLQAYFPNDKETLSWETLDYIESLPFYTETDEFIYVHAGLTTDKNGVILSMKTQVPEVMVYSRDFKENGFYLSPKNKPVLFGHTPCSYKNGSGEFIKTPKTGITTPKTLADYSKIRLDCGVFFAGFLGALRLYLYGQLYRTHRT